MNDYPKFKVRPSIVYFIKNVIFCLILEIIKWITVKRWKTDWIV